MRVDRIATKPLSRFLGGDADLLRPLTAVQHSQEPNNLASFAKVPFCQTRGTMATHILMAERRRVTEEFRARLTCIGILRTQLFDGLTDEARQYLYVAVERNGHVRGLGDKLLQLEASIQAM